MPPLQMDDFALAWTTPFQMEMLSRFGGNTVCMDSTHSAAGWRCSIMHVTVMHDLYVSLTFNIRHCSIQLHTASDCICLMRVRAGRLLPNLLPVDLFLELRDERNLVLQMRRRNVFSYLQ